MKMIFNFNNNTLPVPLLKIALLLSLLLICITVAACAGAPLPAASDKIRAVATTTIIGDVVKNVGGENLELYVLVPPGVDEHSFQYTPNDVARAAEADVIFMSSPELETFALPLLEAAGSRAKIVSLSNGALREGDPHVWTDPNNVMGWVTLITGELAMLKPDLAGRFQSRAEDYTHSLSELDQWISQQVNVIPTENRKLVSDHQMLAHFARRYGFETVGAIIPSFSTVAEPSAQELADLEDTIRRSGIKAIFVGNTASANLAEQVAVDTGIKVVPIYTESLSSADGPASSYLDYMRFNIQAIVEGLK